MKTSHKRFRSFLAALLLLTISALGGKMPLASATANTCTPISTFTKGSTNFDVAANWTNCGGGVPQAGDSLTLDVSQLEENATIINNLPDNRSFNSIIVTGSNLNGAGYIFQGNDVNVSTMIENNSNQVVTIKSNITLTGNATIYSNDGKAGLDLGLSTTTINLGGHTLTLGTTAANPGAVNIIAALHGTGNVAIAAGSSATLGNSNTGWTNSSLTVPSTAYLTGKTANSFGAASNTLTIANGGEVQLNTGSAVTLPQTVNVVGTGLNGDNGAIYTAGSGSNITFGGLVTLTGDTSVNGVGDINFSNLVTANHHLTKGSGMTGRLINNAADNQPALAVNVDSGMAAVIDGQRGAVTIASGGALYGTGTIGALVANPGSRIAPGHSPGCLNTGNLTLNGSYEAQIGGTTACTQYDQLAVTGTVDITGATLTPSLYNSFVPRIGDVFTVIDNDASDAVTGSFIGLAEGDSLTISGVTFKISYSGGTGNDVTLTVTNVDAAAAAASAAAPGTPNTGLALIAAHPLVSLISSTITAGSLYYMARRLKPVGAKQ